MRAQVPYLARLARRAAGQVPLQPPRQLFADTAYSPVRPPAGDGSADFPLGSTADAAARGFSPAFALSQAAEEPPASPQITSQSGEHIAGNRTGGAPVPIDSGSHAGTGGHPAPSGRADRPRSAQVTPSPLLAPRAETSEVAVGTPVTSAPAGPITQPPEPTPSATPRTSAHAARVRSPGSSATVPFWEMPVELPYPIERASVTSQASTRLAAQPALPPPGLGPAAVGSDQDQLGDGTGTRETPGGWDAVSDNGRSRAPAALRDLLPPPAQAPRPTELAGPGPGGSRQQPAGGRASARVSIGTIEVTVVPPARPAVHASESRAPAQMPRGRSRPASPLTAGADRLRDGLRRWYGIAQG